MVEKGSYPQRSGGLVTRSNGDSSPSSASPHVSSRSCSLITVAAYHLPPVALAILRRFSSAAALCADKPASWAMCLGPLRDERSLLLRQRGEQVEDERVNVGAELGDDERHAVNHQARNEMPVTGEPVELGHDNRATKLSRRLMAAASCGRRSMASAPLPVSCSSKVLVMAKP
jgi:hypothetical protein